MGLGARQQFGRYVAVASRLHRLDPIVKVVVFAGLLVSIFLASRWYGLCVVGAYVAALLLLSRVRLAFYGESLKYFTWMFALSFAINVIFPRAGTSAAFTPGALAVAGLMAGRLVLMVLAAAVFTVVTPPSEIGDCVMVFSKLRGSIGRWAAEFASVLAIALRFVPVIFEEAERVRAAQTLRGARPRGIASRVRGVIYLVVPLLESSLGRAANLGFAMEARCYGYRVPASRGIKIGANEASFLAAAIVVLFLTVRLR